MEFSNFLNWKDKLPINQVEQKIITGGELNVLESISTVKLLNRPEDLEPVEVGSTRKTPKTLSRTVQNNFFTSSSLINAVIDDHTYGVPTVRVDLPAPRIKPTAHNLLHPPLHSLYGVHEKYFRNVLDHLGESIIKK
uniref:Uncharacterized protein n=1 Tax=Sinocyclocheilus grahami TaxID=75366 RepID=A0A672MN67_SINGR